MADDFASFARRLDRFLDDVTDDATAHAMGKKARELATKAASADLGGDPKFSGWAPELKTGYDIIGPGRIIFKPNRSAAGPWTVAQYGRNQAAGPRMTGPRLTRTGRVSRARVKRWNGRTVGKGTADDALKMIDREMPGVVDKQVGRAVAKFFR